MQLPRRKSLALAAGAAALLLRVIPVYAAPVAQQCQGIANALNQLGQSLKNQEQFIEVFNARNPGYAVPLSGNNTVPGSYPAGNASAQEARQLAQQLGAAQAAYNALETKLNDCNKSATANKSKGS